MANDRSHVGMAEGSARMGPNGLEVLMIAGNERDSRFAPGPGRSQAGMVGERWVPLSEFTVRRAREVAAAEAVGKTLELPTATPSQGGGYVGNAALKRRGRNGGHILDHIAPAPPKPVTIQDHSGGMVTA
jgi:hypothetical protein